MAFQMNDMTKPVKDRLGFDPASVKKLTFGELIKKIGPGIILTGIVIGPGNITTSAMMGANYGYKMLWLLIPIILMGITFTLSSYRISIMTGLPILHAIRHYYGGIASGFCGVALFLSCFFFTLGNITGTGAGMNLIFGFDWRIGSLIMLAILAFCYLTKGVYSKVEKGIMICLRNSDCYRRSELGPGRTRAHTSDSPGRLSRNGACLYFNERCGHGRHLRYIPRT